MEPQARQLPLWLLKRPLFGRALALRVRFLLCRCIHCIDGRFKSAKLWVCNLCNESLKKTCWDVWPIEEQRFRTEVQHRQETNRTSVETEEHARRRASAHVSWLRVGSSFARIPAQSA